MMRVKIIHTFLMIFAIVFLTTLVMVWLDDGLFLVENPLEIF